MKKLKKFIVYVLLLCLLLNLFVSNVFAVDDNKCIACNSTPNWMQTYINFEVEMLWLLQSVSTQPDSLGINRRTGLFAWWQLSLSRAFLKSTVDKIKRELDSEEKAIRALNISSVILTKMAMSWLKNSLSSTLILYKDEAIVRDYKILQEVDMSANDVVRDMWVRGIRNDRISSDVQLEIAALQMKYSKLYGWTNPIFDRISISSSVKYKNLLSFILNLNDLMKQTLYHAWNWDELKEGFYDLEDKYSEWNIIIEFNDSYIESIVRDYNCVSIANCSNGDFKKITWLFDKFWSNYFWSSMQTIKNANKDLKEALGSWSSYDWFWWFLSKRQKSDSTWWLTDKQIELLRVAYGIDSKDLTSSQMETLKNNWQNVKDEMKPFTEAVNDIKDYWKKTKSYLKDMWDAQQDKYMKTLSNVEMQEVLSKIEWQQNISISENAQNLIYTMQDAVDQILLQKSADKQILLVSTNLDTHYFVEIWSYIHFLIENEIRGSVNVLWETCNYQCSNKWNENCFAGN